MVASQRINALYTAQLNCQVLAQQWLEMGGMGGEVYKVILSITQLTVWKGMQVSHIWDMSAVRSQL